MKRIVSLLVIFLIAAVLCACAAAPTEPEPYSVEIRGVTFTVDTEKETIFDGTNTYRYVLEPSSDGYSLQVSYPDGTHRSWTQSGTTGYGTGNTDYSEKKYASMMTLCTVLEKGALDPPASAQKSIPLILLLGICGAISLFAPHTSWYLSYGWRYKNAEPSNAALWANRVAGALVLGLSVILLFV